MMRRPERTWKIGDLARATGLTVRTLHHYDTLGLLCPASRTERGHRCYTPADVKRLHHIVALRSLGIPLQEIGLLLDGKYEPIELVRRQLSVVDERIGHAVILRAQLVGIVQSLSQKSEPSIERLLQVIEETVVMNEPGTPHQLAQLRSERDSQIRELSDTEFASLKENLSQTWSSLSRREQERLVAQRRSVHPAATGGELQGRE